MKFRGNHGQPLFVGNDDRRRFDAWGQWARKIFTVFQWPDADDSNLRKDQESLLERRF